MTTNRVAVLLLAVALAACKKDDDVRFEPPPELKPVLRQISGVIVDARTGALVTRPVEVSVLGSNGQPSAYALDLASVSQSRFTTRTGVVSFQVATNAPLPADFVIVARAGACSTGSARVRLAANGHATFEIRLVDPASPPEGVKVASVAVAGTASATGQLAAPVAIQTPAGVGGATARFSVPAGT
ncbi:MAG TPA: hypothetical protein VD838_17695, partial [Anaeromyxobacteraceae bacterium]|nr:hypothetical protein [Anaeromyxobacteraceae bacterium]